VPVSTEPARAGFVPRGAQGTRRIARLFPGTPPIAVAIGLLVVLSFLLAFLAVGASSLLEILRYAIAVFLVPALAAGALTPSIARGLGGKFSYPRSFLLSTLMELVALPFLLLWWIGGALLPGHVLPDAYWIVLLIQGPVLWARHLSLFGVSNPSHARTLPASLLQPVVTLGALFLLVALPTAPELAGAIAFLLLGFLCAASVLRAADGPLRREFGASGVGLIRPLLDHVGSRDATATAQLEEFFGRRTVPSDLRVTAISFAGEAGVRATVALPTVHPGPFAAVGASDLPRKIDESLGGKAGIVFVPHTPCNHDLDIPNERELDRVRDGLKGLLTRIPAGAARISPLFTPREGSLARAQVVGDAVMVLISQAPAPTDDIDYAVINPFYGKRYGEETPVLAFIDAHNCYYNDEGDLTYGSPAHKQLARDIDAAVEGALRAAHPGPVQLGVAVRQGYTVAEQGIAPEGIRALVLQGAGRTTAYVLIDGNNLLTGFREPILAALRGIVDDAEVMTTDNHVVHEVDGGINAVGERYPADSLARDVRGVVEEALRSMAPVTVSAGRVDVPAVQVLGPAWTARLLTSLGDTLSVFANSALTTFLLLVTSSLVVVAVLQ